MRDRGTLIAGAGVALACLLAGAAYLFFMRTEAAQQHAEEARFQADMQLQHVEAIQRRFEKERIRSPEDAILASANFLIQQQSADGAWRSDTYATFKSGLALTPLVVVALQEVVKPGMLPPIGRDPIQAGCDFLAKLVKADGTIAGAEGDLDFPVYTAALSVIALSHPGQEQHAKARDAWLKYLLTLHLTEKNGWKPEDKPFGGWGYCRFVPKKPEPGALAPPLMESNLSATVFALEALKAAGVKDKTVTEKALAFVRRCQNANPGDGGFTFIYDDPVRNKAGETDGVFNSYGSATADGLRALRLCGEADASRIEQAERWVEKHFRADSHPGNYIPTFEPNRNAVFFYYAASVSRVRRSPELAAELARRQNAEGSWANELNLVREDEPLVATANAMIALSHCIKK